MTKAANTSMESLRRAVINRWLNGCDAHEYKILHSSENDSVGESAFDLATFARRVRELARNATTGQFGGNKVFLSHIWEEYDRQTPPAAMTRETFNAHLLEANRRNLITLSRADLISEMDPEEVEASEIALPHATFHFLRTDAAQDHLRK